MKSLGKKRSRSESGSSSPESPVSRDRSGTSSASGLGGFVEQFQAMEERQNEQKQSLAQLKSDVQADVTTLDERTTKLGNNVGEVVADIEQVRSKLGSCLDELKSKSHDDSDEYRYMRLEGEVVQLRHELNSMRQAFALVAGVQSAAATPAPIVGDANIRKNQQSASHSALQLRTPTKKARPQPRDSDAAGVGHEDADAAGAGVVEEDTDDAFQEIPVIQMLHSIDFRNEEHLKELKVVENYIINLSLYSDEDNQFGDRAEYSIRKNMEHGAYLPAALRDDPHTTSSFWDNKEWQDYPTILEIREESDVKIERGATKYSFPKYIWEVGEIYNRKVHPRTGQWQDQSTGFHLVMDITKPSKALWIVYRHAEQAENNKSINHGIFYARDRTWHPFAFAIPTNFNAAVIFKNVEHWDGNATEVGSFEKSTKLAQASHHMVNPKPVFMEPILNEVKEVIARGWRKRDSL